MGDVRLSCLKFCEVKGSYVLTSGNKGAERCLLCEDETFVYQGTNDFLDFFD